MTKAYVDEVLLLLLLLLLAGAYTHMHGTQERRRDSATESGATGGRSGTKAGFRKGVGWMGKMKIVGGEERGEIYLPLRLNRSLSGGGSGWRHVARLVAELAPRWGGTVYCTWRRSYQWKW